MLFRSVFASYEIHGCVMTAFTPTVNGLRIENKVLQPGSEGGGGNLNFLQNLSGELFFILGNEVMQPPHKGVAKSDPFKTPAGIKFCNPHPFGGYNIKRGVAKLHFCSGDQPGACARSSFNIVPGAPSPNGSINMLLSITRFWGNFNHG